MGSIFDKLRKWQKQFLADYRARAKDCYLLEAAPGGGKTFAALALANYLMSVGIVERIQVCVHTDYLKEQWIRAAHELGIELTKRFPENPRDGFHGNVASFQSVCKNPLNYRVACRRSTLLIGDEVHHLGDDKDWGPAFEKAFDGVKRKLLLSGTPFRSDGDKIPGVEYQVKEQDDGVLLMVSKPDFTYSYANAVRDGVCREATFESYGCNVRWSSSSGKEMYHSLEEELSEVDSRERLRAVVDPHMEYFAAKLAELDRELEWIRSHQNPRAAGIIAVSDIAAAAAAAPVVAAVTGEEPSVINSDSDDPAKEISEFASGNKRWVISVKMLSEGVDISRLQVGMLACNTTTDMFFRQFLGRIVRATENDGRPSRQRCVMGYPAIPRFVELANRIHCEVQQELKSRTESETRELSAERLQSAFRPIETDSTEQVGVAFGDERYNPEDLAVIRAIQEESPVLAGIAPEALARFMDSFDNRKALGVKLSAGATPKPKPSLPREHERALVAREWDKKLRKLCMKSDRSYKETSSDVKNYIGKWKGDCTLDELKRGIEFITRQLKRYGG